MRIVILTGAGISAESGLGTFRDAGGIWSQYDLAEVATPEGFARAPTKVIEFYNSRRRNALEAAPNAAHHALARLEREFSGETMLVTQNIDDLHERAGSQAVTHMHGRLLRARCPRCDAGWEQRGDMAVETPCPACGTAPTRPDIVWFGEIPMHMDEIAAALGGCDLFVSIGTSGTVYPAAGFVTLAREAGAQTLELNLEASEADSPFDIVRTGPASELVPSWVGEILDSAPA